jgi:hypothetical protein
MGKLDSLENGSSATQEKKGKIIDFLRFMCYRAYHFLRVPEKLH